MDWVRYAGLRRRGLEAHALGARAEDLAQRYLERRGWRIAARDYRPRGWHGDIDLIAWDGDRLVMVEVKSRTSSEHGDPERAMSGQKERTLMALARRYMRRADIPWERVRFDLIQIVFRPRLEIRHQRDIYPVLGRPL